MCPRRSERPQPRGRPPRATDVGALVSLLGAEDLRSIVVDAAAQHEDVARAVRLTAGRADGDLTALRAEIDQGLRTRRFLGYRESSDWAREAEPIVSEIRDRARTAPSPDLLASIERAAGHVVKVMFHADDSNGTIGDLARELLELHAQVCDEVIVDPMKLARWMLRFSLDDQDFFELDPVRYAGALGELGLAAYRREVRQRLDSGDDSFGVRYAQERLAVLDRDVPEIVRLLGGDLRNPYQFIRVAEAMEELGRDEDVVAWARRGIAETTGWQVARLYDLASEAYARKDATDEIIALRRDEHRRMPSPSTYELLRDATEACGSWGSERELARAALDPAGLVDVLLADGEPGAAWDVAVGTPEWEPRGQQWALLAEAREASHPADALAVYLSLAGGELGHADRGAYTRAASLLKRARRAAENADEQVAFSAHMADLRERHRRRPALIQILDRAGLV